MERVLEENNVTIMFLPVRFSMVICKLFFPFHSDVKLRKVKGKA